MAEACAIVANSMRSAIILAFGILAVGPGPPVLTSARSVEAVPMCASAACAVNESAITPVETGRTNATPTSAHTVTMAIRYSTKVDSA